MNVSDGEAPDPLRRWLLAAAAAGLWPGAAARAAVPARVDELSSDELDASLDLPKAVPNLRQLTGRWASNSEKARAALGAPRRLAYGPSPVEALDLFPTRRASAPVHVFLHGGAFNLEQADHFSFLAEATVQGGAHFVVPDFGRARDHGGDIRPLVAQVRRAVAWVRQNAAGFGGDPDRIYLSGHSSGAELAAHVLVGGWERAFGIPGGPVHGALLCSGIYDMVSFSRTRAAAGFKLDDQTVAELSILPHLDRLSAPLIVACGSAETAAFQIGAKAFAAAANAAGKRAELLVADGYNHFEVIETLANPYGVLGRAMLALMGVAA